MRSKNIFAKQMNIPHYHADLPELLAQFKHALCSDPRDKVYAFLSLAKDKDSNGIEPDYSKTFDELCADPQEAYP
jgi:hypothetical protein